MAKLNRFIFKIKNAEMKRKGLKPNHLNCLYFLNVLGGKSTAQNISNISGEDKSSISRALSQLERAGYVTAEKQNKKKYNTMICLTELGKITSNDVVARVDEITFKAGDGLSRKNRDDFYKYLSVICKNLELLSKT